MARTAPLLASVSIVALAACGGGYDGGSGTTSTQQPTCRSTALVTITAAGFDPPLINVPGGGCVRFTSGDAGPHAPKSNPHELHTDCPELNSIAPLAQGQSFTAKMLGGPKTCGVHDHLNPPAPAGNGPTATVTETTAAPAPQPGDIPGPYGT